MLGRLIAGVGVGYACWRVLHRRRLSLPIFSIGLVADVQAANKPDGFGEARVQRYALAFAKLEQAVTAWLERQLACVLSLGDIVDGNHHPRATRDDLARVLGQFRRCQSTCEVHHVLGNHCLQDLPRTELLGELGMRGSYYRVQIAPGWYLLALDTTDLSLHGGWAPSSAISRESEVRLLPHFPNMPSPYFPYISPAPCFSRRVGLCGCALRLATSAALERRRGMCAARVVARAARRSRRRGCEADRRLAPRARAWRSERDAQVRSSRKSLPICLAPFLPRLSSYASISPRVRSFLSPRLLLFR